MLKIKQVKKRNVLELQSISHEFCIWTIKDKENNAYSGTSTYTEKYKIKKFKIKAHTKKPNNFIRLKIHIIKLHLMILKWNKETQHK